MSASSSSSVLSPQSLGQGNPHIAGLILARGGSQGIPLKNLALLSNKPLLSWALGPMVELAKFDSLWVSTDHPDIAACANTHPGVQVFHRSAQYAQAESPSILAVQEWLSTRPEVDVVALIQCTSPFVKTEFLERALDLVTKQDYDSVFSVTREKKFRWAEVSPEERDRESTTPLNFNPACRPRRQDWKGDLVENGMFYFAKRHLLESSGVFQGGKCTYIEVPPECSLEIDSPLDLAFAKQVLSKGCH